MLLCANNIPIHILSYRLKNYFDDFEIAVIFSTADEKIFWTDGHLVVICTDNREKIYSVIAPDTYRKLLGYSKEGTNNGKEEEK